MAFDLSDYNTVAERIVEFRDKYPDGRLRQANLQFIEFGGKSWVVFTAEALRTADDAMPAQGTAWEEVPGKTQFTRDSELQNAESAAWGRAIVAALAADTTKGIASREEVRNRQGDGTKPELPPIPEDVIVEYLGAIASADSIPKLQAVWEAAGKRGATRDKRVLEATNKRKAALTA